MGMFVLQKTLFNISFNMYSINNLFLKPFSLHTDEDKLIIDNLGWPIPPTI